LRKRESGCELFGESGVTEFVVFTDLDGTLLDHHSYSFEPALPALRLLKKHAVPVVLCTSKTRAETAELRGRLGLDHPFITENGGGIFIPPGYPLPRHHAETEKDGFRVITLGVPIAQILAAFARLKESFRVRGFSDMDARTLARETGLNEDQAALALRRDFSEPFEFPDDKKRLDDLKQEVAKLGLGLTRGGRFFHLVGPDADKGAAVGILSGMYRRANRKITTVALGDSLNDLPMLRAVDIPFLVQKSGHIYDPKVRFASARLAEGVGPEGWNRAILSLLSESGM
jgi:mannosyl-3-phosphoglycerate phosphatase